MGRVPATAQHQVGIPRSQERRGEISAGLPSGRGGGLVLKERLLSGVQAAVAKGTSPWVRMKEKGIWNTLKKGLKLS